MLNIIIFLILIIQINGFMLSSVSKPNTDFNYVGDIKPLNYFDPFQLTSNSPNEIIKLVREGELHHGRIAMLAFPFILFTEINSDDLGINFLSCMDFIKQLPFWISMITLEFFRMIKGWKNPFAKSFSLKEDYQPGNVLNISEDKYNSELLNKELANGRLAMIGTFGLIVQELVTGKNVF